jgi:hypothetical protein
MKGRKFIKALCCASALCIAPLVQAAMVSGTGTITVFLTNLDYGGGDVTFRISSYVSGCSDGYWISPSQPGFKTSVAYLLKAHANGETILVGADTAQRWPGSGGNYCKVDYVGTPY